MSSVLVFRLVVLLRVVVAVVLVFGLRLLRFLFVLVAPLVAPLLLAGSCWTRVEALNHNPTRERAKDKRAHEQDRSDHTESAKDVAHHVTNYQRRRLTERSLDVRTSDHHYELVDVVHVAEFLEGCQAGVRLGMIACDQSALGVCAPKLWHGAEPFPDLDRD